MHSQHSDPPAQWAPRVVEAALDAIVTIDEAGRVLQFNRAAERMFGYRRDEVVARPVADLIIPPDLRAAHWAELERLRAGEHPRILDRRVELRGMRRDGTEFPVEVTVTQASDSPLIWTGFVRDLTHLKAAVHDGTRAASMFEAAEELASMGSWDMDVRSPRDATWSEGMYRIHGREPGSFELVIEDYIEVVHPEDRQRIGDLLAMVVEQPERVPRDGLDVEYRIVRPDGAVRRMRARGRIELDELGQPARWVGVGQDVTELRRTERELHAHYAVEQAFRDWESFDEGTASLLRRLGSALEYELGSLWTWNDSDDSLRCRTFWTAPGVDAREFEVITRIAAFRPGEGIPGRAYESGAPVLTENLRTETEFGRGEAASRLGLRTGLAFPAVGHERPLAVLSYYSAERHEPSERLVRTLTGIGEQLGRFLEPRWADLGSRPVSARELDVLRLAAEGNTGPQIAAQLSLSPATVKTHFENIYDKLGVGDRAAAVARAMRLGLIR